MALIATNITPTLWQQALTGPGEIERATSSIPRAILTYGSAFSWPAAGGGDDREVRVIVQLPRDYAYFMTDCTLSVNNHNSYMYAQSVAICQVIPDTGPGATAVYEYQMRSHTANSAIGIGGTSVYYSSTGNQIRYNEPVTHSDAADPIAQTKVYNLVDKPKSLFYPYQDTRFGSEVRVQLFDNLDGGPAYTGRFAASFIQYDIDQAYNQSVNQATLTR